MNLSPRDRAALVAFFAVAVLAACLMVFGR